MGGILRTALVIILSALPAAISAEVARYICSNAGIEVQCGDTGCTASESFTPMQVSFVEGELSVCAYSGCWSGKATGRRDATGLMVTGEDLAWSGLAGGSETFRFALSFTDMRAMLLGGSFAQPLHCNEMK